MADLQKCHDTGWFSSPLWRWGCGGEWPARLPLVCFRRGCEPGHGCLRHRWEAGTEAEAGRGGVSAVVPGSVPCAVQSGREAGADPTSS